MPSPTVLVATWSDGLFVLAGGAWRQELAGQSVRGMASDGHGGALVIVNGHSLRRRDRDGAWITQATSDHGLSCCVAVADAIYVGTDDANILRVVAGRDLERLAGFDRTPGREHWYAGTAVIDGRTVGPPLGIRSISAASDGSAILANVHVGGIPRSTDRGATWQPTIDIHSDVHEVSVHPSRPALVAAAAGIGFCMSRDGGITWEIDHDGLHANYCSAVAFADELVIVAAAEHHFADQGAIYKRPSDGPGKLEPFGGGLPAYTDGIVDSGCIAARGSAIAVADKGGNVYTSTDCGLTWVRLAERLPSPSGVLIA